MFKRYGERALEESAARDDQLALAGDYDGRAIRAGLGVIDAVGRLKVKSAQLQARVGVATGLVVVNIFRL